MGEAWECRSLNPLKWSKVNVLFSHNTIQLYNEILIAMANQTRLLSNYQQCPATIYKCCNASRATTNGKSSQVRACPCYFWGYLVFWTHRKSCSRGLAGLCHQNSLSSCQASQINLLPSAAARYQTFLPTPQYGFKRSDILKSLFRIDDELMIRQLHVTLIHWDTYTLHTWHTKVYHLVVSWNIFWESWRIECW